MLDNTIKPNIEPIEKTNKILINRKLISPSLLMPNIIKMKSIKASTESTNRSL